MSVEVITLGCRLNLAESATMRALARDEENLVIVNSCAVTNEAVRQTRQAIRRAKRARPGARVVVTGCAAQIEPETFTAMPEVSGVVENGGKLSADAFSVLRPFDAAGGGAQDKLQRRRRLEPWDLSDKAPAFAGAQSVAHTDRTRAFVAVQNGCDHRCTFCIIPYGRGPSRSVPAGLVVEQVQALVAQDVREIVLTGVDVTSYGPDLPGAPTLGSLIERILKLSAVERLRLSSIDCIELDERLIELVTGERRIMPHLHLSLQAGDDMILKRMKRRHSRREAVALVERLKARRIDIAIGADLIAGFPTETEAMAANSLRLIDDCDIVMGHIFPYSAKAGTPAARMPQVGAATIKARAKALREAAARRRAGWLESLVGTTQRVLVERDGETGHAENFAPVRLTHPRSSRAQSKETFERGREPNPSLDCTRQGVSTSARQPKFISSVAASRVERLDMGGRIADARITAFDGNSLIGTPE